MEQIPSLPTLILILDTRIATVSGNTSLITAKAEQQGEWTYYEATYTANTDIDTVNCAFI